MQEDTIPQDEQPIGAVSASGVISLGQEYAPLSSASTANPYPFYARARQEEPIFFSEIFNPVGGHPL
jgi:hypothetical protein